MSKYRSIVIWHEYKDCTPKNGALCLVIFKPENIEGMQVEIYNTESWHLNNVIRWADLDQDVSYPREWNLNMRLSELEKELMAALKEAPIKRLGESESDFISRYKVWFTIIRREAIDKAENV